MHFRVSGFIFSGNQRISSYKYWPDVLPGQWISSYIILTRCTSGSVDQLLSVIISISFTAIQDSLLTRTNSWEGHHVTFHIGNGQLQVLLYQRRSSIMGDHLVIWYISKIHRYQCQEKRCAQVCINFAARLLITYIHANLIKCCLMWKREWASLNSFSYVGFIRQRCSLPAWILRQVLIWSMKYYYFTYNEEKEEAPVKAKTTPFSFLWKRS